MWGLAEREPVLGSICCVLYPLMIFGCCLACLYCVQARRRRTSSRKPPRFSMDRCFGSLAFYARALLRFRDSNKYVRYLGLTVFCRAAYNGTRVTLRQVSPESEPIYDLILALHHSCGGDWKKLQSQTGVSEGDVEAFLSYAAQFLGNLGGLVPYICLALLTASGR